MKTLIKILAGLAVLLLIAYLVVMNMPQSTVKSKEVHTEISAVDLFNSFSFNEKEAERKYVGQVIQITGLIDEVYPDEEGAQIVLLKSEGGDLLAAVTLESNQSDKVAKYQEGDPITLKALCSGMLMEVTLSKGIVVD